MKSKLKSRFQWGGGNKTNGAFPTSKPNYSDASINITPVRVGTLNLKDNPVIDTSNHGNVTISTLSNNDRAFSKKRFDCGFDSDERATMREQMWYRNQSYLKEQEKRDGVASNVTSNAATNVASRYASDKRWSQYDHEEGSDAPDSPVGVTELDSFNHRLAQRSDSETYTHQSSSFMDATDSTSVYDDDGTRSTLFYSEGGTEEDSTFENITLGTLDTNTRYEMADADKSKKYQLGRGTPPKKLIPKDKRQSSKSRSPPPRRRDRSYSMDDASSADVISSRCPFPIADELRGTIQDVSLACSQILHAFFISPDDVDKMSDKIRDACYDLREYHAECKSSLPSRR